MLITVYVDPAFNNQRVKDNKFTVDIDPNETVENLKVSLIKNYFF